MPWLQWAHGSLLCLKYARARDCQGLEERRLHSAVLSVVLTACPGFWSKWHCFLRSLGPLWPQHWMNVVTALTANALHTCASFLSPIHHLRGVCVCVCACTPVKKGIVQLISIKSPYLSLCSRLTLDVYICGSLCSKHLVGTLSYHFVFAFVFPVDPELPCDRDSVLMSLVSEPGACATWVWPHTCGSHGNTAKQGLPLSRRVLSCPARWSRLSGEKPPTVEVFQWWEREMTYWRFKDESEGEAIPHFVIRFTLKSNVFWACLCIFKIFRGIDLLLGLVLFKDKS